MKRAATIHLSWFLPVAVLAMLAPPSALGQVVLRGIHAEPGSGIDIQLTGAYDNLPTHGFVPVQIDIANNSGRNRSWKFSFNASSHHRAQVSHAYTWDVSVPSGAQRSFDVLVPVSGRHNPRYTHPSLSITAFGYGLQATRASYHGGATHSGLPTLALIGMTPGLSIDYFGPIQGELVSRGKDVRMATLTPDLMLADWRAYSGFESIWTTRNEWEGLREPVRQAILTWVLQGGRLVVASHGGALPALPPSARQVNDRLEFGLGSIHPLELDRLRAEIDKAVALMERLDNGGWAARAIDLYGRNWGMAAVREQSGRQAGLLVLMIFAFAVVVGPVNLIWLAGRSRRWRLFVTTPLISLVASLMLGAGILAQDGIGGRGARVSLVLLAPELRQMLVVQEQSATTGLLLRRDFALTSDHIMHRLDNPHVGRQPPLTLQRDARSAGGDWFSSRDVQAHVVSSVVPSRARIELLNAAEVLAGGDAPRLLSTIEAELESFYYVDPHGKVWVGEGLRAGESQVLEPAETRHHHPRSWWQQHVIRPGLRVHPRLLDLHARPGYVVGAAKPDTGRFIETLPSIRWENRSQIYIGPVVSPAGGAL